jgi:hypothetical protein
MRFQQNPLWVRSDLPAAFVPLRGPSLAIRGYWRGTIIVPLFYLFGADGSLVGRLKGLLVTKIKFLLPFVEQRRVYPLSFFAHEWALVLLRA